MRLKTSNLLGEAGRPIELVVGWVCALMSLGFCALLVYLVYLVGWRNPQRYGRYELFETKTLVFMAILLFLSVALSLFAFRLLQKKNSTRRLMSPIMLRFWGSIFGLCSIAVFIDCVINNRWGEALYLWHVLTGSVSMAVAAFVLAGIWQRNDKKPDCDSLSSGES